MNSNSDRTRFRKGNVPPPLQDVSLVFNNTTKGPYEKHRFNMAFFRHSRPPQLHTSSPFHSPLPPPSPPHPSPPPNATHDRVKFAFFQGFTPNGVRCVVYRCVQQFVYAGQAGPKRTGPRTSRDRRSRFVCPITHPPHSLPPLPLPAALAVSLSLSLSLAHFPLLLSPIPNMNNNISISSGTPQRPQPASLTSPHSCKIPISTPPPSVTVSPTQCRLHY
jgi:hypothetical protein